MKKPAFIIGLILLGGCVTTPQYTAAPPSVSQIQGGCFASREAFLDQASCIQSAISRSALNPYAQEYMAYMQSLSTKVEAGTLSEDDARVKLAQKLNTLRQKQNSEFARQEELNRQRTAQTLEVLKQNTPKPLDPNQLIIPPRQSTNTNCQVYGNQVNCTTY